MYKKVDFHYLIPLSKFHVTFPLYFPAKHQNSIKIHNNYYLFQLPTSPNNWLTIASGYEKLFPHCIGALDGKHVVLESPVHSGSEFFNYKKDFSIVLLALVDADYRFIFADVGCQGRMSDGGVLRNSILWDKMNDNTLNLPRPYPLPGRNSNMPYVFVADSAFALSNYVMKPYPGKHTEQSSKRNFNRILSRARVKVENVFGIITSIFRVFKKAMLLQPDKASIITMACIYLHNFLRKSKTSQRYYSPPESFDRVVNNVFLPGTWRNEDPSNGLIPIASHPRRASTSAQNIREEFAEYFAARRGDLCLS